MNLYFVTSIFLMRLQFFLVIKGVWYFYFQISINIKI